MKIQIDGHTFLEAEQDSEWLSLEDAIDEGVEGLCIVGLAACYGFVMCSKEKMTACHLSSIYNKDFLVNMFEFVQNKKNLPVRIILLRSSYGYTFITEDDARQEGDLSDPVDVHFAKKDKEYIEFFKTHFKISPQIVNIKHNFFSISLKGAIELYNNLEPGALEYNEVSESDSESYDSSDSDELPLLDEKPSPNTNSAAVGLFSDKLKTQKRLREEDAEGKQLVKAPSCI
ncbi:MAG: hypothetical protein H0U75_12430 [Legionella sp.]|nr:hypothetical protein [Legionella sp.]